MENNDVPSDDPRIAVIGMAGRFPGAGNLDEFWKNLRAGRESVHFLSTEELLEGGVDPALLDDPDYVRAVAELPDADAFDAPFFGISHREAETLDPQQRVLMECAWHALENAGYNPESMTGRVGLYAGATTSTYLLFHLLPALKLADPLQLLLGNAIDTLTTRIAYKLNLRGPAFAVQCACSTSLVALHLAVESLLDEECDMALAGGVSINYHHRLGYRFLKGSVTSSDGHCRPFDARAEGSIFSSGAGVVVLKRLADALADGDPIRAVVLGSAINNDGRLRVGYTAPSVEGQAEVIADALDVAGIDAETIGYIEAHGTATELGDPIEIQALTRAFRERTERKQFCAIGAVKSNVGHLDVSAGIAGLIKTILALEHREIPPTVHFERPNPKIDFAASPVYPVSELQAWERGEAPRRAGVSSFGMGGTNAHVILEEAPEREPPGRSRPWQLLVVSARTPEALAHGTEELAAHLAAAPEAHLADVGYTLRVGRRAFEHRRMLVCRDCDDAVRVLRGEEPDRLHTSSAPAAGRGVAFLLPGIGEHYPGMGAGLYRDEPVFREAIDRCAELAEPQLGRDLRELLELSGSAEGQAEAPSGGGGLDLRGLLGRSSRPADMGELDRTLHVHPAIFAVEYALAELWMSWGIRPRAMIGHSLGEYVAACLAGVVPLADALRLVIERARLIDALPAGAMLAVTLPEAEVTPLLGDGLSLSAVNSSEVSVLAGENEAIAAIEARLGADGVACRRLPAVRAYHSTMMEPAAEALVERWRECALQAPEIPFVFRGRPERAARDRRAGAARGRSRSGARGPGAPAPGGGGRQGPAGRGPVDALPLRAGGRRRLSAHGPRPAVAGRRRGRLGGFPRRPEAAPSAASGLLLRALSLPDRARRRRRDPGGRDPGGRAPGAAGARRVVPSAVVAPLRPQRSGHGPPAPRAVAGLRRRRRSGRGAPGPAARRRPDGGCGRGRRALRAPGRGGVHRSSRRGGRLRPPPRRARRSPGGHRSLLERLGARERIGIRDLRAGPGAGLPQSRGTCPGSPGTRRGGRASPPGGGE